jgi:hypothetical protein
VNVTLIAPHAVLLGIGDEFVGDQSQGQDLLGRDGRFDSLDLDGGLQDVGELAAQAAEIGKDRQPLRARLGGKGPMHARDGGDAIGRGRELARRFGRVDGTALQVQQAGDELQAVHRPVIVLAGHDHRLSGGATGRQAHLELVHHDGGQGLELADPPGVDRYGLTVHHAQRAEIEAVGGAQRHGYAKPAPGFADDVRGGDGAKFGGSNVGRSNVGRPDVGLRAGRKREPDRG